MDTVANQHVIGPYLEFGWQCSCGAYGLAPAGRVDHLNLMGIRA